MTDSGLSEEALLIERVSEEKKEGRQKNLVIFIIPEISYSQEMAHWSIFSKSFQFLIHP